MKKLTYTLGLFALILSLTAAVNSYENKTLAFLFTTDKELVLPDVVHDYSVDFPDGIFDELMFWGEIDTTIINGLNNDVTTLGRVLFYDDRLSADNSLSCGSCHNQALSFGDGVALSEGINGDITTRNSPVLNDLGWQISGSFFWDFRTTNLEDAVLEPILNAHELGKDMPTLIAKLEAAGEDYSPLFVNAYGDNEVTEARIADALSQFVASMASFESRFDQGFETGFPNFTTSEMNGMALFQQNCNFCHVAPHFGGSDPFYMFIPGNNGLDDVFTDLGLGGWMNDPFFDGTFKSPSLRNIEVSAPYMHDGRFQTLEEVVDFYSNDVKPNANSAFNWMFGEYFTGYDFTDSDKEDLVNFLRTLTDNTLLTDDKWSDPFQLTTGYKPEPLTGVQVYPNPVSDVVIVEFENASQDNYNIAIYDLSGKLVNSFQTSATILEVPRNNLPAGIYELIASSGAKMQTFKLIYK